MNPINKLDIYSWMVIVLSIFAAAGIYTFGWEQTLPQTLIAVAAANALDILSNYIKKKEFRFTKTATITGLFIGQLLPLSAEFYLPVLAAAIAIASKHVINWKGRHIFNPTLFSLLIVSLFLSSKPAWWGSFAFPAQPFSSLSLVVVAILGALITFRQRRHELVWPMIAAYMVFNFVGNFFVPGSSPVFSVIDATTLYAMMFMVVEPRTSPLFPRARLVYGIVVAFLLSAMNFFAVDLLPLAAILVGNLLVLPLDKYFRGPIWQISSRSQTSPTSERASSS